MSLVAKREPWESGGIGGSVFGVKENPRRRKEKGDVSGREGFTPRLHSVYRLAGGASVDDPPPPQISPTLLPRVLHRSFSSLKPDSLPSPKT